MSVPDKPQVFFNSACPVCRAGSDAMQSCDLRVEWVDVAATPDAVEQTNASLDAVRERLYFKDEAGRVHIGADAFAELWLRTPKLRWLGGLLALPGVRALARLGYNAFARCLYRWNVARGRW